MCNKKAGDDKETINSNRAAVDLAPGESRDWVCAFTAYQVKRMRKDDQRGEEEAQKVKIVKAVGGSLLFQSDHKSSIL